MAALSPRLPKYRHYRPKNLAVVRIDGRDFYLGAYGSPESHEKHRRLVAEWLVRNQPAPEEPAGPGRPATVSVGAVILAYWGHAERYYRTPEGQPTGELANLRDALRPLRELYSRTPAVEFGPLALRAVRQAMVDGGRLRRTTINDRVKRIRRAFRWAASVELIPASVVSALENVEPLRAGRSGAKEAGPVCPVPAEHVEAVLPHLSRPVAAMVQVQLLSGCRAGEVMAMRGRDLTFGEPNWEYRPDSHKNAWRGKGRVIPLGPRAQEVIRPFLTGDPEAYLFSPRQAVAEHHGRRSLARRTRRTPSEESVWRGSEAGDARSDRYDRRTYRQAVVRACLRAGVPGWSPSQLRHTAATLIRSLYGLEAAQTVLGHAKPDTTLIYAERDLARAHSVASDIG